MFMAVVEGLHASFDTEERDASDRLMGCSSEWANRWKEREQTLTSSSKAAAVARASTATASLELGVPMAAPTFGLVWEGLGLPHDIRDDASEMLAAAVKLYDRTSCEHPLSPQLVTRKLGNARNMLGSMLLESVISAQA